MQKRIIVAAVLIAFGLMIFAVLDRVRSKQDEGVLALSGNVEATEVAMGFKIPGQVVELAVEEGLHVKKGDRLAALQSAEIQSIVAQQKASLAETVARYDEVKNGSRKQEIEQARASVLNADAELTKAKKDLARYEVLFAKGAVAAQKLDEARKNHDVAVSQHRKTLEAQSLVHEGARKEVIRAAGERVKQAEAAVRAADERLKDTVIHAPLSGIILRKNAEEGETVAAGVPVYTIGDLETPWIKVYVKESDLGRVKLGQKVGISTDSYPGKIYEGSVSYISSEAEFTPKNVQTREERVKLVFGVKVRVKNINGELKPGMPADVKLSLR